MLIEHFFDYIFQLKEKSVEDIMVPRAEIISIEKKQSISQILSIIENESHSRMPVYDQNLYQITIVYTILNQTETQELGLILEVLR